jgi:hypothetical protein
MRIMFQTASNLVMPQTASNSTIPQININISLGDITPVPEPITVSMLYDSQTDMIYHLKSALDERSWREAYHLLANMGFPYEGNYSKLRGTCNVETKFANQLDAMTTALTNTVRNAEDAEKNLLSWSSREARGKTDGGLGPACSCPHQQKVVHEFLKQC